MLRGIHKASASWLGKGVMAAVMGVLVISFAIWGIGDIFRGFGLSTFAKVGGTEIGIEQFREYYNEQLQQIGRRIGRPVTPDQARALGIDRQLIAQLIAQTALDERARQLHLGASDKEIADSIRNDPSFRGINGQFDRDRFEQLIRQAGFTEGRFVNEQRRVMLRKQLADAITSGLKPPATAIQAIDQYQNEKRAIDFVTLGEAQAGDIPAPTPEQLTKYFNDRKVLFRAPEYRKIVLLSLTAAEQAKWITVSDADAKKYYEQHKNDFGTPERRHVLQMVFQKPEEAQAAADSIAKGKSFADVAKDRSLKNSDIDLGTVTKSGIIDPAIAKAAFELKEGATSAPIKGEFGTVLVQVTKIEPGKQPTYEQVAPQIKRTLAEQQAKGQIGDLRDKIEDERAAGSTLEETAKKLGLTSRTIDAVDRSGRAPDGSVVPNLPKQPDIVSAAFSTDVGVDNDPLQVPGGGYLWYEVAGVTPSRERNLDEVKSQVETRWRDDEIASRLKKKADDMLGKLKSGDTLAQLAKASNLTVEKATDLQRGHPSDKVPGKVLDAVFRTAKGTPAAVEGDKQTERYVFVVTDVKETKPDLGAAGAKQMADTLQRSYTDDLLGEYVTKLESQLGVDINQQAVNQIVGGGTASQ
ncbi:MAG TPA: SurA N-terminal domain-containing protein [Pseudolabrys sp.]|nr:SurA N-terminal domain-containing protein [Pseudolabrys sp.]